MTGSQVVAEARRSVSSLNYVSNESPQRLKNSVMGRIPQHRAIVKNSNTSQPSLRVNRGQADNLSSRHFASSASSVGHQQDLSRVPSSAVSQIKIYQRQAVSMLSQKKEPQISSQLRNMLENNQKKSHTSAAIPQIRMASKKKNKI